MTLARRIAKAARQRELDQRKRERASHRLVSIALRDGHADEAAYHLAEAPPRYRAAVALVAFAGRLTGGAT